METITKKMKPRRLFAVVFLLSFTQANEMTQYVCQMSVMIGNQLL